MKDMAVKKVIVMETLHKEAPIYFAAAALDVEVITFDDNILSTHFDEKDAEHVLSSVAPPTEDTVAMYLHTSGTTSRPKLVPLTHKNILTSLTNIIHTYKLTPSDATLVIMPLFHVHGLMASCLSTLHSGGTLMLPRAGRFSASTFWADIKMVNATWYTAVPTMHQILLLRGEKPSVELRFIRSCSSGLPTTVLEKVEALCGAKVLEAYAMTEASHQMTSNPLPERGERRPGTVGIGQGVDVVIMDDGGSILGSDAEGEVCIRGLNVTHGYVNNGDANEKAFSNGYFRTGDRGVLSKDGYLRLTGRLKELINRGGEKISPMQVEECVGRIDGVREVVAFGVADEKYGEVVGVAVVAEEGAEIGEDVVKEGCKSRIAAFKVPERVWVCDRIPRTATGKVQRLKVATWVLGGMK